MSDKLQGGILAGSTSISLPVILRKTADNTEQTGTVAAGVTAYYWRQGGTPTALTAASDLAAITSAFAAGGWKAADGTNAPGVYRLDVDNAAFASGADWVVITVKVANCYLFVEKYPLTSNVIQSGDSFARLGAPAGASIAADIAEIEGETDGIAAIPTSNPSAAQIATAVWQDATAGDFTVASSIGKSLFTGVAPGAAGGVFIAGSNAATTVNITGNLSGSVGSVTAAIVLPAIPANWITAAGINAAALNGKGDWLLASSAPANFGSLGITASGHISNVDTLTTYTGNTPQTGDCYVRLGAPAGASVSADIAAIKANTATLVTGVTVSAYAAGQDPATLVWAQAMTELVAVPSVTDTMLHAMEWLFILSHNKITETATTQLVRNNADAATIGTATVSDDGTTFARTKYI